MKKLVATFAALSLFGLTACSVDRTLDGSSVKAEEAASVSYEGRYYDWDFTLTSHGLEATLVIRNKTYTLRRMDTAPQGPQSARETYRDDKGLVEVVIENGAARVVNYQYGSSRTTL